LPGTPDPFGSSDLSVAGCCRLCTVTPHESRVTSPATVNRLSNPLDRADEEILHAQQRTNQIIDCIFLTEK